MPICHAIWAFNASCEVKDKMMGWEMLVHRSDKPWKGNHTSVHCWEKLPRTPLTN